MLPLPPRDSTSIGDGFALKEGEQGTENETPLEAVSCSGRVEGYLVGLNSGEC